MKKPLPQLSEGIGHFTGLLLKPVMLACCLLFSVLTYAQSIRGKVFDAQTGEPLVGATITLKLGSQTQYASARLDGSFSFKNLKIGQYQLSAKYIGYQTSAVKELALNGKSDLMANLFLKTLATQIGEVTIAAHAGRESDGAVRGLEKAAPSAMNILSANAIQLLPDVTVANSLQRVSGVTIQRSASGEGRYAIIRGMAQRYNNTLVNGIKIPSPDDAFRFVPMDIFPSEMLERLEVIKALTPSMEGDAIGGTMNLVMKSAPDQLLVSANLSGGLSNLFSGSRPFTSFKGSPNKQSPSYLNGNTYPATFADFNNNAITSNRTLNTPFSSTAGLTIGDRFLDKRLGVIISASYQNIYRGSDSKQLTPNAQPSATPLPNSPQFSDAYDRSYSVQTQRLGLHNKIDFKINDKNKISLYNLYIRQNEFTSRQTADTLGLGLNSTNLSKQITLENRSQLIQQNIYNSTLHGDHVISNRLRFNWDGVYSIATRHMPDRTDFSYDANRSYNAAGVQLTELDNKATLVHHWENNRDRDLSGYGNFIYNPTVAGQVIEVAFGGLYRHKNRSADYIDYTLGAPNTYVYTGNFQSVPFAFNNPSLGMGINNQDLNNNYTVTENDNAEYGQVKFNVFKKLQVLGGVRIENTNMSYLTQAPLTVKYRSGNMSYTDVLPSVNLKYVLAANQNLRASYFSSLSRPGFGEIVPYKRQGEYYDEIGNPELKHITADNLDLRYELFPGGADQLLVGTFFKKIHNPIEYFAVRGASPSTQYIKPQNDDGDATNYGAELQATKFIGTIGFSVNYTYTHSRITTDKLNYFTDPVSGQQQTTQVQETRPLQGQADHVGNASILYKSSKIGLDMQLAFVYTGERLSQVSPYLNLDFYQHAYNQLDFSFEKKINQHFSFFGKINNITNAAAKIYLKYPHTSLDTKQQEFIGKQDIAAQTLVQSDYYKTLFLGGFRYKL